MSLIGAVLDRVSRPRPEPRAIVVQAGTTDQPSETFLAGTGALPVSAGVSVTARNSEGIPTVYACDKVIKQDVAKTPIKIKRRNTDGTRADDTGHPIYSVLHDLANPLMTAYEFKETMQGFLNLWGNGFAQIDRDGRNNVIALWPLDPARMTVDFDGMNRLRYSFRMAQGAPKVWIFDPANPPIFHLRQNALDGIHGRSPVTVLRETMGSQIAAGEYEGRFYGQGGHPSTTLTTDAKLTQPAAERIKREYEALTTGRHNWHRPVILDHGLKPAPNAYMSNRDAQFVDLLKLGQSALCGAFRVPPHKIAQLDRSTNNNIEHQAIEYVGDCLMPHFVCWQQAIARDLLNTRSFNTHFAVFVIDSLLRGDMVATNSVLQLQRQNGVINANQWRQALDMDDQISDADGGDLYLVNGNMMPLRRDPAAAIEGLHGMSTAGGVQ